MDGFAFDLHRQLIAGQRVEFEVLTTLLADASKAIALCRGARWAVAPTRRNKAGAIGAVVRGLTHDDGVLSLLEHAGWFAVCIEVMLKSRHQQTHLVVGDIGAIERKRRSRVGHLHLHDGARVGAVAGQRGGRSHRRQVWPAGVVVVGAHSRRERCGGVVVQDQRLALVLRKVDNHIGTFGWCE